MSIVSVVLTVFFATLGTLFVFLAAIGIVRMPDLYSRMQTATKASTFGSICCMIAVGFHYQEVDITFRVLGISVFLFLTAPIAAHVLCLAGVLSKVPLSDEHVVNHLSEKFTKGGAYEEA